MRLTLHERVEAVRKLHSRGYNDTEISERIGITKRSVLRIRQRTGLPPNVDSGRNPTSHPRS